MFIGKINLACAVPVYTLSSIVIVTVPADVLAHHIVWSRLFSTKCFWLSIISICLPDAIIQNGWQNLKNLTEPWWPNILAGYIFGKDLVLKQTSLWYTVRFRCHTVDFLCKRHKRQPIACPGRRDMRRLVWVQSPIYFPYQLLQCCALYYIGMRYHSTRMYWEK